jgi:hypothetical protein
MTKPSFIELFGFAALIIVPNGMLMLHMAGWI